MNAPGVVVLTPREPRSLANRASQAAYGSRRVSVWTASLFVVLKLSFAAFFSFFYSSDHLVAVGRSSGVPIIFRSQGFEDFLHLVAVFGPVEIHLMQNKPKLETWIRTADVDAVSFTMRHRFLEARMFVPVEHRPDLVVFLERIFFPATAPVESQRLCEFDGLFCNGVGNAHGGVCFQGD